MKELNEVVIEIQVHLVLVSSVFQRFISCSKALAIQIYLVYAEPARRPYKRECRNANAIAIQPEVYKTGRSAPPGNRSFGKGRNIKNQS